MTGPVRYPHQVAPLILRLWSGGEVEGVAQNQALEDPDQELDHRPPALVALVAQMLHAVAKDEDPAGEKLRGDLPDDGVMAGHETLSPVDLCLRSRLCPGVLRYDFQERRLRFLETEIPLMRSHQQVQLPM